MAAAELEGEFSKKIGDTIYELEIQPCLIYLGKITPKGERQNEKYYKAGKVDVNMVKKELKIERLPFEEM